MPQFIHPVAGEGSYREIEWFYQLFQQGQSSISYLIEDAPEPFRTQQIEIGVKSTHLVPIYVGGQWWGVLGLDDCREAKHRSPAELAILKTAAACIGNAIQRDRSAPRLRRDRTQKACLQAEQARVADLAKTNTALKNSLDRLAANPDLNAFLGHVTLEAVSQLGADAGHLTVFNEQRETLSTAVHVQQEQIVAISPLAREMATSEVGAIQILMATRQPQFFNLEKEAHLFWAGAVEYHQQHHHRAVLAVPLYAGGKYLGNLGLAFTQADPINEQESELLQALSNQAALAIQLTRLAEEAKQTAIACEREKAARERAIQLAKANKALKRSLTLLAEEPSLDNFLGYVLQAISDQLGDRSGAVYLFDDVNNTTTIHLNYENGHLQQGKEITHPGANPTHPPQAWDVQFLRLLRQNQILIHHQPEFSSSAYDLYRQHNAERGSETLLFVPLLFEEQLLNILTLRSLKRRYYTPEELELARALAHQATLAIELTRLAEEARQLAIIQDRNFLAREIHDTLAQGYAGILMQLQATLRFVENKPEKARLHLERARNLAREGLAEARRSVWILRQESETYSDLAGIITQLAEQMAIATSIKVGVEVKGKPYALPPQVGMQLLRIAQESINNALRHARPNQINILLTFEPEQLCLEISDDGCGFKSDRFSQGFGLKGMQQRADAISAKLNIHSQIGIGTKINIELTDFRTLLNK